MRHLNHRVPWVSPFCDTSTSTVPILTFSFSSPNSPWSFIFWYLCEDLSSCLLPRYYHIINTQTRSILTCSFPTGSVECRPTSFRRTTMGQLLRFCRGGEDSPSRASPKWDVPPTFVSSECNVDPTSFGVGSGLKTSHRVLLFSDPSLVGYCLVFDFSSVTLKVLFLNRLSWDFDLRRHCPPYSTITNPYFFILYFSPESGTTITIGKEMTPPWSVLHH